MANLTAASESALRALRDRIAAGDCSDPLGPHDGGLMVGVPRDVARAVVAAVLAEREARPPAPELVWTGPSPAASGARDTATVLDELFDEATERVLVAGYSFDHGKDILRRLHAAMGRGVQVDVFLDIKVEDWERSGLADDETRRGLVEERVNAFLKRNWPGEPLPAIHYDERPLKTSLYASLHAKCVVVDEEVALVTSANFTNRGQERNVEVGVVIRDRRFAESLAAQWRNALNHDLFATF